VTSIVAFVPDLMDRSKVAAVGGDRVGFVTAASELASSVDPSVALVVVDLGRPGVLDAVRQIRVAGSDVRVVGFGSHVERDLLDAAGAAGCDEVLARSAFFGRLADVLG